MATARKGRKVKSPSANDDPFGIGSEPSSSSVDSPGAPTPYTELARFVHPNSWNWMTIDQISEPAEPDIDAMCGLQVPPAALRRPGDGPELATLAAVTVSLKGKLDGGEVDPFFNSTLLPLEERLLAKARQLKEANASMQDAPNEGPLHVLAEAAAATRGVADAQARLARLAQSDRPEAIDAAAARLQSLGPIEAADAEPPVVEGGGEEAMVQGWEGGWWERATREKVDEALALKVQSWTECEEKDELVEGLVLLMAAQVTDALARIVLLDGLGAPDGLAGLADLAAAHQARLDDFAAARQRRREAEERDLQAVERLRLNTKQSHDIASARFAAAMGPSNVLISDLEERIRQCERRLQDRHDSFLNNRKALEWEEQTTTTNVHAARLREEIRQIEQMIEQGYADIKAKEEEIAASDLEFERQHRIRAEQEKERIRLEKVRVEAQLEEDKRRLKQELAELKLQLEAAEKSRSLEDRFELERVIAADALLSRLLEREELLRANCCAHTLVIECAALWREMVGGVAAAIHAYCEHVRATCTSPEQVAAACLSGLEWTFRLLSLLRSTTADKQQRILSVDRTLVRHIKLLEFCVDTHDPNAHKHQTIIAELRRLRAGVQAAVERHERSEAEGLEGGTAMWRRLQELSRVLDVSMFERLTKLRQTHPDVVRQLEQHQQPASPPPPPGEAIPPAPHSRMVHVVGAPVWFRHRSGLAAPFGPPPSASYESWLAASPSPALTVRPLLDAPENDRPASGASSPLKDTAQALFAEESGLPGVRREGAASRMLRDSHLRAELERLRQTLAHRSLQLPDPSLHHGAVKALSDLLASELLSPTASPAAPASPDLAPARPATADQHRAADGAATPSLGSRPASASPGPSLSSSGSDGHGYAPAGPAGTASAFSWLPAESHAALSMAERRARRQRAMASHNLVQPTSLVTFDGQQFMKKGLL